MEETIKALRDPSKAIEMPQRYREIIALIAELFELSDNYNTFSYAMWADSDSANMRFWEALEQAKQILLDNLYSVLSDDICSGQLEDYVSRG